MVAAGYGSVMGRTTLVRRVAIALAAALMAASCADGDAGVSTRRSSDATAGTAGTAGTEDGGGDAAPPTPEGLPPLLDGDLISDAAVDAVLDDGGDVDDEALAAYASALIGLPPEQQRAVLADLSLRTDLAAASVSGLEAAIGDRALTEAALTGAYAAVQTQVDTAIAEATALEPAGFLRTSAPSPSAGAVATGGLFLGYFGLATSAGSLLDRSNSFAADETGLSEGDGVVYGASIDEVGVEMTFNGKQDGVDVQFVAGAVVHPCPNPDGTFTIEVLIDVKASKGGAGQNARMELKIDGTVGDDAELASKNVSNRTQWSDFGGGRGQFLDITMSGEVGIGPAVVNRTGGTVTDEFAKLATTMSGLIGAAISMQLIDATEKAWKSGRCVRLDVTPSAGPDGLTPSQTVDVLAAPRSKIDGQPTGGNVTATLSAGGASVEPNGSPVPADANSTYTAPGEQDKSGTVSYESRSKRGIGKADVTFKTSKPAAYRVAGGLEDWQVDMVVCDVMQAFTLESPGVGVAEFSGGLSGTYTATGIFNFSYAGTYEITLENGLGSPGGMVASSGGQIAGQAGSGSEVYTLTPATC
jgi:hypothetical protein